jgi:hypothetical protein
MVLEILSPGMEERDEADLCTQVFRVRGDRTQGRRRRRKQSVINDPPILDGESGDGPWDREDDVKVLDGQGKVRGSCTMRSADGLSRMTFPDW